MITLNVSEDKRVDLSGLSTKALVEWSLHAASALHAVSELHEVGSCELVELLGDGLLQLVQDAKAELQRRNAEASGATS